MATSGFFTYHDLYGGKPENYHHQIFFSSSSSTPDTTTTSVQTTINVLRSVSSTTIQSSTSSSSSSTSTSASRLHQLVQLIPFAYFHWFLIGLAVLLAFLLIIVSICYCCNLCKKHRQHRKEKKQPLPNFYRYRTGNRRAHGYNIFETSVPISVPSPARPCPQRSVERLNNQLLRQGLDAVGSPQVPRINTNQAKPSNAFTNNASDLLTQIKSRLSTHSFDPSPKKKRLYETQDANMAFNEESKSDSSLINMD